MFCLFFVFFYKNSIIIGFTDSHGVHLKLQRLVSQVVLHGEGNGQRVHLLGGHDSPQGHAAQVLEARHAARARPEVHAAIARPVR